MRVIDSTQLAGRSRPTPRILQFGGGNFLRAFVDWKIDRMNEAAGTDWGVIVIRSIAGGNAHSLNEQDGTLHRPQPRRRRNGRARRRVTRCRLRTTRDFRL